MKVKDLVEQLAAYPPDAEVFMASDAEGNSYANVDTAAVEDSAKPDPVILWPHHERLDYPGEL